MWLFDWVRKMIDRYWYGINPSPYKYEFTVYDYKGLISSFKKEPGEPEKKVSFEIDE
jgi:hypothetical protein